MTVVCVICMCLFKTPGKTVKTKEILSSLQISSISWLRLGEVVTLPSVAVLDLIFGFRLLTTEESSGSEVLNVLIYIFRLGLCGWFTVLLPLVAVYTHCSMTQVPLWHSNWSIATLQTVLGGSFWLRRGHPNICSRCKMKM